MTSSVLHVLTKPASSSVTSEAQYTHRDHLGSVDAITNSAGAEVNNLAYDPYGLRRDGGWSSQGGLISELTDSTVRGFTDHEHLDRTGFVHMNGRVFDPRIGRFLQPDPFVQFPASSQSFNRYSYVVNDPTSLTDPSGYRVSFARRDIFVPRSNDRNDSYNRIRHYTLTKDQLESFSYVELPTQPADPIGENFRIGTASVSLGDSVVVADGSSQGGESTLRSIMMRIGEYSRGSDVLATIAAHQSAIENAALYHRVDPNLIRAVIYEEQTHQLPFEGPAERFGIGATVGLGQVTVGYYGYSREQLLNPGTNIAAVARHLLTVQGRSLLDTGSPIASIATRYNSGSARAVTPYGRRVSTYYDQFSSGAWP